MPEAGGVAGGAGAAGPRVYATCQIFRFDDFGIEIDVTNGNEWDWSDGLVSYDLTVMREEVLVQQSNNTLPGVARFGNHAWREDFLGAHFPGKYVATLTLFDQTNGAVVTSDLVSYTR